MELFYAPGTVALTSLIALHEADLPFKATLVDFGTTQQQSSSYLKTNPKGRVPALVCDQGTLSETPAILAYIASLVPEKNLAPSDPFAFAKFQEFNSYLASTVHVNHAHGRRGHRWANAQSSLEDMAAKVPTTMAESFALIQEYYLQGPWVMGAQYTLADGYLFKTASWLKGDGVDITTLPRIAEHYVAMKQRPAVQKALSYQ